MANRYLTPSEISDVLNNPKRDNIPRDRYMILSDGTRAKLDPKAVGSFDGKQGTQRRSSKGRTYRLPNGSRRYIVSEHGLSETVIAYKTG
jgi:hypothetical protein